MSENKLEKAVFASGCFWCTEAVFKRVRGVKTTMPGYAGGQVENPTYEQVSYENTGHAEAVEIQFDGDIVSYKQLVEVFFYTHDPTQLNRQGNDVGTQYRSAIFFLNEEQHDVAKKVLTELEQSKVYDKPIVTEIIKLDKFFPAEEYHHDYFAKNPDQSYCQFVIRPKIDKLEKTFKSLLDNSSE